MGYDLVECHPSLDMVSLGLNQLPPPPFLCFRTASRLMPQISPRPSPRVLAYLFTAYTASTYKWGFFALGTLAWLLLAHSTLRPLLGGGAGGRRSLSRRQKHSANTASTAAAGTTVPTTGGGRDLGAAGGHHRILALWTNLLWLNYPLAFGLSDGGNRIGVVASLVWFGILDLLMVPVLAAAFLMLARRWDYGRLNLAFTQYGRVSSAPGTFPEKHNNNNTTAAAVGPGPIGGPVGGDGHLAA